jgi:predicted ATPase
MELTKIEIENYKSIKSPIAITFSKDLPTVLIGKNGSGKTNVLEALSAIALANTNYYGNREKEQPTYRAYIQLCEDDVATMLPDVVYDKNKCEIVAYSSGSDLKIDRVRSEYIVSSIRKEIADIRDLALQLKDAVDLYEKQLIKISHDGYEELPIHCYNIKDENGRLTNYNVLHWQAEHFIDNVRKVLDHMLQTFEDDEAALTFVAETHLYFGWNKREAFRLEYVEPSLAKFEQKFVSINKTAIKREITKINKATKDTCDRIDYLIKEIEDRTKRIQEGLDTDHMLRQEQDERYYSFLRHVQNIIGKRCLFLKNESNDVIFRKEDRNYYYNDHSNSIMETYLRQVYDGGDREELLRSSKNELTLSERAVADFEAFLNENIPSFDREMYDSISVQAGEKGHISIFLNEKTGEQINLNETSAGRRWYFTYYFMKNILSEGDIFIIDEPAAMLHPSAQREVLCDLMELTKRGVKVVYSTHSPYLIPDEWQCVHFVTMTEEGTEVNCVSSNQELVSQMTNIVGEDIFDIQIVLEKYILASPEVVARNISELIRETQKKRGIKNLQIVCDEIGIEHQAMKSWNYWPTALNGERNKKFSSPSIQNIAKVLRWAKKV